MEGRTDMQDTGLKNRIFLALFISIIFFIVYDYFFIQPQLSKNSNEVVKNEKVTTKSEEVKKSTDSLKTEVLSVIKSENFEIHIDNLGRISQYILEKNIFNDDKGKKLEILGDKLTTINPVAYLSLHGIPK
jgi:YidC/Oxa1 family membrane protein insertase